MKQKITKILTALQFSEKHQRKKRKIIWESDWNDSQIRPNTPYDFDNFYALIQCDHCKPNSVFHWDELKQISAEDNVRQCSDCLQFIYKITNQQQYEACKKANKSFAMNLQTYYDIFGYEAPANILRMRNKIIGLHFLAVVQSRGCYMLEREYGFFTQFTTTFVHYFKYEPDFDEIRFLEFNGVNIELLLNEVIPSIHIDILNTMAHRAYLKYLEYQSIRQ